MATIQKSFCAETKCFTADASAGGHGSICMGSYGCEGAHVQVVWDTSAGQTADLRVGVFGSQDGTTLDTVALTQYDIPVTASSTVISSFVLRDVYWVDISCKIVTAGADVSGGDVSVSYSPWEWSSS